MLFFILLFIVCVAGGKLAGDIINGVIFPNNNENNRKFIDKSVHHHYHEHNHEHKNISIIDDETKNKIFELKKSRDLK